MTSKCGVRGRYCKIHNMYERGPFLLWLYFQKECEDYGDSSSHGNVKGKASKKTFFYKKFRPN